jgi:predicted phage tail protein
VSTATESASESQVVSSQTEPLNRLDKVLALVPRALSSHAHIIFLGLLGVYLVVLPLVGVSVSAKAELIGGNYTNVTSDLGACIAAGLTVHLAKRERRRSRELEQWFSHLHRRHDELEKALARAVAAAERAEQAVRSTGSR